MSRRKKDRLRPLTELERQELARISRSQAARAVQVVRATMLLAVSRGDDYQRAAVAAGRRSGDAVSHLVARFNAEGLAAFGVTLFGIFLTPVFFYVIRRFAGQRTPALVPAEARGEPAH